MLLVLLSSGKYNHCLYRTVSRFAHIDFDHFLIPIQRILMGYHIVKVHFAGIGKPDSRFEDMFASAINYIEALRIDPFDCL